MCEFNYRWTIRRVPEIWGSDSPAKIGDTGVITRDCEELLRDAQHYGAKNTDQLLARWNAPGDVWFYEAISPSIDFSGGVCHNCLQTAKAQCSQAMTRILSANPTGNLSFGNTGESSSSNLENKMKKQFLYLTTITAVILMALIGNASAQSKASTSTAEPNAQQKQILAGTVSSDGKTGTVSVKATRPRIAAEKNAAEQPQPKQPQNQSQNNSSQANNQPSTSGEQGFSIDLPTPKGWLNVTRGSDRSLGVSIGGRRIRLFK